MCQDDTCTYVDREVQDNDELIGSFFNYYYVPKVSIHSVILIVPRFGVVNCLAIDIHPTPCNNVHGVVCIITSLLCNQLCMHVTVQCYDYRINKHSA